VAAAAVVLRMTTPKRLAVLVAVAQEVMAL
jgi:hypothetical protein